ncbi:MAG: hypothetical protein DSZ11_06320 [Sulfurovum sp.]|nr:MAG: hypothetical protein DSZ11_06320 [Sulfurovum sp.]
MKKLVLLTFFSSLLLCSNLSEIYKLYEKQEYEKGCDYGAKYYSKNIDNENYLTFYGLSCLETNSLNRVAQPMVKIGSSKELRETASYFATIVLQKQLLKQFLLDGKKLSNLKLPKTDFVLSRIFNLFVKEAYTLKEDTYLLQDSNKKDIRYEVYIKKSKKNIHYMIIDIYQGGKFTKRYQYD